MRHASKKKKTKRKNIDIIFLTFVLSVTDILNTLFRFTYFNWLDTMLNDVSPLLNLYATSSMASLANNLLAT